MQNHRIDTRRREQHAGTASVSIGDPLLLHIRTRSRRRRTARSSRDDFEAERLPPDAENVCRMRQREQGLFIFRREVVVSQVSKNGRQMSGELIFAALSAFVLLRRDSLRRVSRFTSRLRMACQAVKKIRQDFLPDFRGLVEQKRLELSTLTLPV